MIVKQLDYIRKFISQALMKLLLILRTIKRIVAMIFYLRYADC